MNINEFKKQEMFKFENKNLDITKILNIMLLKNKYNQMLNKVISLDGYTYLYFDELTQNMNRLNDNISRNNSEDILHISHQRGRFEYTLSFDYYNNIHILNTFKYFRKYSRPDYTNYLKIKYILTLKNITEKIATQRLKNYINFLDVHNSNILLLLTWMFYTKSKNKYNLNSASKMSKFNFLKDDNLLFNDPTQIIEMLYESFQIIQNNKAIKYHNIKIGHINLIYDIYEISIKLHNFLIIKLDKLEKLLKYKYIDNIKIQLLTDYLINNNEIEKVKNGIQKYIFNSLV